MCLIALDEVSVLIMTYASAIRSGLVKIVLSSLADLSTIALVRVLSCHFPHVTFSSQPFLKSVVKLGIRLIGDYPQTFP